MEAIACKLVTVEQGQKSKNFASYINPLGGLVKNIVKRVSKLIITKISYPLCILLRVVLLSRTL